MQDTTILTLSRFSPDSDPSEGAEQFVSAGPGHQPQRPLRNSQGPTEWPLGPSRQRQSLQHGLQSATSAGCQPLGSIVSVLLSLLSLFWLFSATIGCGRRSKLWLVFSSVLDLCHCHRSGWTLLWLKLNSWLPQGKDDVTGEPLIQHDDDKPEALMARLRQYKDVAKPVIDLYKSVQMFIPVYSDVFMRATNIQDEGWSIDVLLFLMSTNIPGFVVFVSSSSFSSVPLQKCSHAALAFLACHKVKLCKRCAILIPDVITKEPKKTVGAKTAVIWYFLAVKVFLSISEQ